MPTEQEVRHVLKRLKKEGWELESGKGSHVVARNIAKGAGWK